MNFCESLSDKTRKRAIRDAIASALFGCIPEMTVDTGAIIVIYIALLGGNDASRMFSSSFSALTAILLTLPAAKVVDLFGTKKTVALACYTAVAMFFVMALAPFLPPAFSLPVFFIALFIYGATRSFYSAAWYPILSNFLRKSDRTPYFSKMRFLYSTLNAIILFAVGKYIGEGKPIGVLQIIIAVFGLGSLGRAYFINRLPEDPDKTIYNSPQQKYSLKEGLRVTLRNSQLVGFSVYYCMMNLVITAFTPLATVYLKSGLMPGVTHEFVINSASISLVGSLIGYLAAPKLADLIGKKLVILISHFIFIFIPITAYFLPAKSSFTPVLILALMTICSAVYSANYAIQSSEILSLARPGNKTVAMAFFNLLFQIGQTVGRTAPAIALGMAFLAPAYTVSGTLFNNFQTIFAVQGTFLVLCLVLLPLLPELVPHRDDYYEG